MNKIVFVGQTPPPYHGQAIMLEKILNGKYEGVQLLPVRMSFSAEMNEIGKISFYKIFHLFEIVIKIYYLRIVKNANVLYYPPAGPDKVPVVRDIFILLATRWLFRKIIFHFHAGGLSELKIKSGLFRILFKWAYYHADYAILLSEFNPNDGLNLQAKNEIVIPYGIEDNAIDFTKESKGDIPRILFVGILKESKGVLVLLEACKLLKDREVNFCIEIMGKFESSSFQDKVTALVEKFNLEENVSFLGVLSGEKKHAAFSRADIFCFPTFYEAETFGVVLLEAMQFSLPVVSTIWRGIPSIVRDGENGFLVKTKEAYPVAEKLEKLICNKSLRVKMGLAGRADYDSKFGIENFHAKMEVIFKSC